MEYGELALFRGITNGEVDAMIHCFHMRQARYESGQTICTYGEGGGEVGGRGGGGGGAGRGRGGARRPGAARSFPCWERSVPWEA